MTRASTVIAGQTPATVRAGLYARLSKDPDGTKTNIEGQLRRCRQMADAHDWTVAETYIDRDRTAAGHDPYRPHYDRMVTDLRAGRINAVVALDQDRLVREPYELELLLRVFEDVGARYLVTSEGEITSEGVMVARIRASVSAEEIRKMKERHRRRQTDIALEGGWGGGSRPFGLTPVHKPGAKGASRTGHVLVVKEDEAKLLREAAKGLLSGLSAESIAAQWNANGVRTAAGKRWTGSGLRRTITSPAVAGLRVHHGEIVAAASWKPVLDRATWEAVRVNLAARPKAQRGRPVREYLLTGLCVCGLCGSTLRSRPRGDRVRSYVCASGERPDGSRACGGVRIVAEPLERLLFEAVLVAVDGGALDAVLRTDLGDDAAARRTDVLAVLAEAEAKLTRAEERYLEGDVGRAAYLRVKARHEGVAAGARRELAAIERTSVPEDTPRNTETLREWWPEATPLQRRTFLKLFIETVRVLPASHRGARFSHERVEIVWVR